MNPDNTIATVPQTSVWVCGTVPAQQPQQQQQQNTLATICTQYGCPPYQTLVQHNCQPIVPQNTAATICTQYGCPPPATQASPTHFNTAFTTCTQHVVCQPQQNANVSVPPHCPTVAPMCPPPAHGGGQAQAQFPTWPIGQCTIGVTTGILTAVAGCTPQQGQAQQGGAQAQGFPPSIIGCQPTQSVAGCTTIAGYTHNPPMCPPPPANVGGQAQAQFPTWPIGQCTGTITSLFGCAQQGQQAQQGQAQQGGQAQAQFPTLPIGQCTHALTSLFGCAQQGQAQAQFPTWPIGQCTGTITSLFGCAQQGQAQQGVYPTLTCPAPQGQGQQQQVLPHTIFPPLCQPGGGQTGAYTHHLMGCTTVTSNPNTPSTHFPGCTGVTSTPATVGQTQLLGCTTVTSTPTTQGPVQGNVHIPNHGGQTGALPPTYHPAGGCGPVPQAANANGGGQAQAQMPTIPVISCAASAVGICTGVWPMC